MPEALQIYAPLLPEIILAVGAMALLMYGVFRPETQQEAETVGWLAVLVMIIAGATIVWYGAGTNRLFDGAFVDDPFARFMKLLTLAGAAIATILAFDNFRDLRILKFEYGVLVLLSTTGMLMMLSAGDLIA